MTTQALAEILVKCGIVHAGASLHPESDPQLVGRIAEAAVMVSAVEAGLVLRLQGGSPKVVDDDHDNDWGVGVPIEEAIYQAYPKKVGKPAAIKAILKALKTIDSTRLFELTCAYARARKGSDHAFTPHPATWFNQQRFNDDPSTWQPGGAHAGPARVAHDLKAKDFVL